MSHPRQDALKFFFSGRLIRRISKSMALCLCLLTLSACADRAQPLTPEQMEGEASVRWQAFQSLSERDNAPFVLSGSLRFGVPDDTRRVTYLLWGNGGEPFRLDIQAGVGATAAKAQVSDGTLLLYLPQDNKAYSGTDHPDKALTRIGMPLPLSLRQLSDFLDGRYRSALGQPQVLAYRPAPRGDGIIYTIISPAITGKSELELSAQGLPVAWNLPSSWKVNLDYDDNLLPRKLEAELPDGRGVRSDLAGYKVILLIKNRQTPAPFPSHELELLLPSGVSPQSLD